MRGWLRIYTYLLTIAVILGLALWVWILIAGAQSVADMLGVWLILPRMSVTWAMEQLVAVVLATACVGVLLNESFWVKPATYASWTIALIEVIRSFEMLVINRRFTIPFASVVYGVFAVMLSRAERRTAAAQKKQKPSVW